MERNRKTKTINSGVYFQNIQKNSNSFSPAANHILSAVFLTFKVNHRLILNTKMSSQSVQAISIPTETIQCFVSEFRSDINSVRCESRISSLSDLIGVLVKRNVLNIQTYEIILQNVLSALQPTEQNILKSYLRFILGNNNFDGQNIYGNSE